MAYHRVKRMKIWVSGVYIVCNFTLEHVKVILGLFSALFIKVIHKWIIVEQSR